MQGVVPAPRSGHFQSDCSLHTLHYLLCGDIQLETGHGQRGHVLQSIKIFQQTTPSFAVYQTLSLVPM